MESRIESRLNFGHLTIGLRKVQLETEDAILGCAKWEQQIVKELSNTDASLLAATRDANRRECEKDVRCMEHASRFDRRDAH